MAERGTIIEGKYEVLKLIGKGGMYGQALIFSREKNTAFAWHAHIENGQSRQLVEYIDEVCKK